MIIYTNEYCSFSCSSVSVSAFCFLARVTCMSISNNQWLDQCVSVDVMIYDSILYGINL